MMRAPRCSAASRYVRSDTRLEDVKGFGSIWPSTVTLGRFAKAMMSRTGRGEREAFNGGIERDCCQAEVKDGPSPTTTDIGVWVAKCFSEISKITADGLPFLSARLIKVASSSELSISPPRLCIRAEQAQNFCLHGKFLFRTDRPETGPDLSGTPHKGS